MMPISLFFFERRSPPVGRRLVAALLAPPPAMFIFGLILGSWFNSGESEAKPEMIFDFALIITLYGSIFAYGGILLVAFPANLLLRPLKAERGIVYMLIGAASGFVPIAAVQRGWKLPEPAMIAFLALPGALTAMSWWLIASRRRDRVE